MVALGIRRHPRDFRSITAFGRVLALSAARGVIRTTKGRRRSPTGGKGSLEHHQSQSAGLYIAVLPQFLGPQASLTALQAVALNLGPPILMHPVAFVPTATGRCVVVSRDRCAQIEPGSELNCSHGEASAHAAADLGNRAAMAGGLSDRRVQPFGVA
jgi:hypothetical protein